MGQNSGRTVHLLPALASGLALAAIAPAQPVEVVNLHGGVDLEVVDGQWLRFWRSPGLPEASEGIVVSRSPARLLVEVLPPQDESPDIKVKIPLGMAFSVRTEEGGIDVRGMVRRAVLQSVRGSLSVSVPLAVTHLDVEVSDRPRSLELPAGRRMPFRSKMIHPRLQVWRLTHAVRSRDLAFGSLTAQGHAPPSLTIRDWKIPQDWPLKPHVLAGEAVERLLARAERRRTGAHPPPVRPQVGEQDRDAPAAAPDAPLFRSDVRLVSMSVAVSDSSGRPMVGLQREAFVVKEDGEGQDIRVADPAESPFNLAILLDLSGSTAVDLAHMRAATLKLIRMARPTDRVALYAMSGSMFHRMTPLTSDRELLIERCARLPYPSGGSPLWDTIALAYDDELAQREGERNALIVISDGIDNRISGQSVPSDLRGQRLINASSEMDARIYPVFLLSGERFGRNWSARARTRLEALARRTGGKLFTAASVSDVEPVLPALAREMRSVYEIAYYPSNQAFDGGWRNVRIEVAIPGARVRARPGYFAD